MEYGIPGGLFTIFFLWGLWEWSKSMNRKKEEKKGTDAVVRNDADKKPDWISRIMYLIIGLGVVVLIVFFIIMGN